MGYRYSDAIDEIDFPQVARWLASTYWSPGISQETVEQGAYNSTVVVGAYTPDGEQVGFARCVSDTTRFAYIADVFVADAHRKRGIARSMVRFFMEHPRLNLVRGWYLFTNDAQGVYEKVGFHTYEYPDRVMVCRKP